ncbi:MAG: hypothetical protein WAU02_02810 [Candidatus Saccharimonadales bacterium]
MDKITRSRQSGMVSILTVLFFMIFISILVVSFIKIMSNEQRQATDSDLSASALAAAQGGVEDAKRLILHCLDTSPSGYAGKPACTDMLASTDCTALLGDKNGMNGLRTQLGINDPSGSDGILVSTDNANTAYKQYYTCMTIAGQTDDLKYSLNEGKSVVFPLNTTGTPSSVIFDWAVSDGTFGVDNLAATSLQTDANWRSLGATPKRKPPVLRAQFIAYDTSGSGFDLNTVNAESRALFMYPSGVSATVDGIGADGNRGATGLLRTSSGYPMVSAYCTVTSGYACSKEINGLSASRQYYVRLSLLYGGNRTAEVTVRAKDSAAAALKFNQVQFQVDVTGKTNDVFRRVQSRLSFGVSDVLPEYALETAGNICKDMIVADTANTVYNCP